MSQVEMHREMPVSLPLDATKQQYVELVHQATDQFNEKLADIERRWLQGLGTEENLLKETSEAIYAACEICAECDAGLEHRPEILKQVRMEFRVKTHQHFSKGYFMNHARTWPQGYPGDYKMLEAVYRNLTLSDGLGYLLDRHFLATTLAVGVRERLALVKELLRKEMTNRQEPRVLDLACGSCREVFELTPEIERTGAQVICIDQDSDALNFALTRLAYTPVVTQVQLRKYNVVRMVSHERNLKEFGQQDIIYSTGLFDYLTDDVLVRLFDALYALLREGGKLICAFKDSTRYRTQEYHWFVDWDAFYQRNVQESRSLLEKANIPNDAMTSMRDQSGVMVFYAATKK